MRMNKCISMMPETALKIDELIQMGEIRNLSNFVENAIQKKLKEYEIR